MDDKLKKWLEQSDKHMVRLSTDLEYYVEHVAVRLNRPLLNQKNKTSEPDFIKDTMAKIYFLERLNSTVIK